MQNRIRGDSEPDSALMGVSPTADQPGVRTLRMSSVTQPGWAQHFVEGSSLCPDDADQQVMCPKLDGGATERRLDTHDKDTFSDAYPAL